MSNTYKMEIKQWNGTDFDKFHPKTNADIVTVQQIQNVIVSTNVQDALQEVAVRIGDVNSKINATIGNHINDDTKHLGALCQMFSGDLNNLYKNSGFYMGNALQNAPTQNWYYIEILVHRNDASGWCLQRLTDFNDDRYVWTRERRNGTWGTWNCLFQFANDGKTAIANAVNTKGVSASPSDTFPTLASKIGQIKTGYSAGDLITENNISLANYAGQATIWCNNYINPNYISITPDDKVYVSCYNNGTSNIPVVLRLDKNTGAEIWKILASSTNGSNSVGITSDPSGNAYVSYVNNIGVKKFSSNGNVLWSIPSSGAGNTINMDRNGVYLYYAVSNCMKRINPNDGSEIWSNSNISSVEEMSIDVNGNIYALCYNSYYFVAKYNNNGGLLWSNNSNVFGSGKDIYVDCNNYIYTCSSNKGITKWSDSTEIWSNNSFGNSPDCVYVDSSSNVYCGYYASSGKIVVKLNSSGSEMWSNCESAYPYGRGIYCDSNNDVYVGNYNQIRKISGNNRFKILK